MKKRKGLKIWQLFSGMFFISCCTFGGGFVIINFMKRRFVDELKWIDEAEMTDMISLAQSSPGAIAVNAANLLGWRVGGFLGMSAAVLGTVLPPMLILSAISLFYNTFAENRLIGYALRGMQAGAAAIIMDVVCQLSGKLFREKNFFSLCMMTIAFIAVFFFQVNPLWLLLAALLSGLLSQLIKRSKEDEHAD